VSLPLSVRICRSAPLFMGLTVAAIVLFGFSHTVDSALIHFHGAPPPLILYFHVLVSSLWLVLFIVQSALVRNHNVRLHRRLGQWGLALGTVVAVVGLVTVYVMRWREIKSGGGADAVAFLSVPLDSLAGFAVPFFLAAWLRTKPEIHRRLMLLATCSLTFAAFARVPALGDTGAPYFTGAVMVIAAGADWLGARRFHLVYLIGIPAEISFEALSLYLAFAAPPAWMAVARFLLGAT